MDTVFVKVRLVLNFQPQGRSVRNKRYSQVSTTLKNSLVFKSIEETINSWFESDDEEVEEEMIEEEEEEPTEPKNKFRRRPGNKGGGLSGLIPNDEKEDKKQKEKAKEKEKDRGKSIVDRNITKKAKSEKVDEESFSFFGFLAKNLRDISFTMTNQRENTFGSIHSLNSFENADLKYMLALSNVPTKYDNVDLSQSYGWSGAWGWKFNTSLTLTNTVSIDGISYNWQRNYVFNSQELDFNDSETVSFIPFIGGIEDNKFIKDYSSQVLMLPDYGFRIINIEKFLPYEGISSIELDHSKSASQSQTYQDYETYFLDYFVNPAGGKDYDLKSKNISLNFSPLIGIKVSLKNGLNFNSKLDYDFNNSETFTIGEVKPNTGSKDYSYTYTFSGGYNIKGGFKSPIDFWIYKGKINGDINMSLAFSYMNKTQKNIDILGTKYEDGGDITDTFRITPEITYKVSRNINGKISYEYSNSSTKGDSGNRDNTDNRFSLTFNMRIAGR